MLVAVTGGSGSGKSAYAEQTAVRLADGGRLLYLATMMRDGAGAQERIRRHRALRRGKGFLTIEKTDRLCEIDPGILQGARRGNSRTGGQGKSLCGLSAGSQISAESG